MLYGKRTSKRIARRYTKTTVSRPLSTKHASLTVGFAITLTDTTNLAIDLMYTLISTSTDWLLYKNNFSGFKVVKVIADYSPFLSSPISASDSTNGWVCIRDGYWANPLTTLTTNELARFPNTIPFNNSTSFSLSRRVSFGDWFAGNSLTDGDNVPKLVLYGAYINSATTNTNKGSLRVRFIMLARGSQIDG